jgi:hypothetical protein
MLRRLLDFAGWALCILLISPIPLAAQDTTPPVLTAFDFTPRTIDTTSGQAKVTATLTATDDLSGVRYVYVQFRSPSGTQTQLGAGLTACEPGNVPCTISVDAYFPQFGELGVWTVDKVYVDDAVLNWTAYPTAELAEMGFPTELTVSSNQDTTPPVLTAFEFTPKTIDTTSGQAKVTATLTAADDLSGVRYVYVQFRSPSGTQTQLGSRLAACEPGTAPCTISVDAYFPQYSEVGVWTVDKVYVDDAVLNWTAYFVDELAAKGFPTELTVTSNQDTTPPVLTAFTFTPTTIDTTSGQAKVTATLTATDDLSGVRYVYVQFRSPSGTQTQLGAGLAACEPGIAPCTISVDAYFPQFGELGFWTVDKVYVDDAVLNWTAYPTAALAEMGFPTQLLVTPDAELVVIDAGAVITGTKGRSTTVTLHALVQNLGTSTASKVQVGFDYSIGNDQPFRRIGVSRFITLAPGATAMVEYEWRVDANVQVRATVDPFNRVAECDEANNSVPFPLIVK